MLFHIHLRLQAAIFDIPFTLTYDSLCTGPVMLLNPENIDIAVEISLLSCILAEIYVI